MASQVVNFKGSDILPDERNFHLTEEKQMERTI